MASTVLADMVVKKGKFTQILCYLLEKEGLWHIIGENLMQKIGDRESPLIDMIGLYSYCFVLR
jgi:hypothetical protein